MLNEGIGYAYGNLCREWETKEVQVQGESKTIWVNALAYQPKKEDETIFVDLTVWPNRDGSDADGRAFSDATSKGSRVMIRGKFAPDSYVNKEGQPKMGWKCNLWDFASMVRAPFNGLAGVDNLIKQFPGAEPF